MKAIDKFEGEYSFLSNFHSSPVTYDGLTYPTAEHAFQAAKDWRPQVKKRMAALATPGEAKKAGRGKVDLRTKDEKWMNAKPLFVELGRGWNTERDNVMLGVVRAKFQDPELRKMLLATGDAELTEGNTWNDKYWGVSNGAGENKLGKILMRVRGELQSDPQAVSETMPDAGH